MDSLLLPSIFFFFYCRERKRHWSNDANRTDIAIALALEATPFLCGEPEFTFREASVPLRLSLNTPLASLVPFATCAEALRLHPTTASILDDMRFLIGTVMKLSESPSTKDLQKVRTTSAWIYERISSLPSESPKQSPVRGPANTSSLGPTTLPYEKKRSSVSPRLYEQPRPSSLETEEMGTGESLERARSASGHRRSPPMGWGRLEDNQIDFLYRAVRMAALVYSRAVMTRQPFSSVLSNPGDFLELWTTLWHVSLSEWKAVLGIFHWIMVCLVAAARRTPHDRLVKSLLTTSMIQIGIDNWEVSSAAMESAVRLQRWLTRNNSGDFQGEEGQPGESSMASTSGSRTDVGEEGNYQP